MSQEPLQEPIELPLEVQLLVEGFNRQVAAVWDPEELRAIAKQVHLYHSSQVWMLKSQTAGLLKAQQAQVSDQVHVIKSLREQIDRLKAREERRRKGDRLALAVSAVFVIAIVLVAWLRPAVGKVCRGDERRDYPACTTEVRDARESV